MTALVQPASPRHLHQKVTRHPTMLRRTLLVKYNILLATGEAAKAKADPKECEVCIANLEAIDKLIDKDEKTSKQSIMEAIRYEASHFSAMTFIAGSSSVNLHAAIDANLLDGVPQLISSRQSIMVDFQGTAATSKTSSPTRRSTRATARCVIISSRSAPPSRSPSRTRMPKDRVCKRLKQSNGEICNVKYQVQVDNNLSDEEMLAQLKKKRVKELKGILNDRGVKCEGPREGRLHQEDHGDERHEHGLRRQVDGAGRGRGDSLDARPGARRLEAGAC